MFGFLCPGDQTGCVASTFVYFCCWNFLQLGLNSLPESLPEEPDEEFLKNLHNVIMEVRTANCLHHATSTDDGVVFFVFSCADKSKGRADGLQRMRTRLPNQRRNPKHVAAGQRSLGKYEILPPIYVHSYYLFVDFVEEIP